MRRALSAGGAGSGEAHEAAELLGQAEQAPPPVDADPDADWLAQLLSVCAPCTMVVVASADWPSSP